MAKSMNPLVLARQVNEVKFFEKNVVERKSVAQCSRELGISRQTLHDYKKGKNFRQMALLYLEDKTLGGLKGTVKKLIVALDATMPIVMIDKESTGTGDEKTSTEKTRIETVPDEKQRFKALQEVIKIYGLHAPQKREIKAEVSISSDAELFGQIEQAERNCRSVESYVQGEKGFELAQRESGSGGGDFEKRERTILQDGTVPQSQ